MGKNHQYKNIYIYIYIYIYLYVCVCVSSGLSAGAVEYTDSISAEGYPPMSVLDMIQIHLIVKLQSRSFVNYGVLLHCYYSQVHVDPYW